MPFDNDNGCWKYWTEGGISKGDTLPELHALSINMSLQQMLELKAHYTLHKVVLRFTSVY